MPRVVTYVLVCLLAVMQYPLWLGKGSYLQVSRLNHSLAQQKQVNRQLLQRNQTMSAEIVDLKKGYRSRSDAVEERARFDLGLVLPDEHFIMLKK
jgi:cell division protein FtsB